MVVSNTDNTDTPDDILNMALDIQEEINELETASGTNAMVANGMVSTNVVESVSSVVNINDQTANFNLQVPGLFDWKEMMRMAKPVINMNNCNVTMNMGNK